MHDSNTAPMLGLVLAGGQSRRMGQDKASLDWGGMPLWRKQAELLKACGLSVGVSIREGQVLPGSNAYEDALISDAFEGAGPLAGWMSAWQKFPNHALLVVACDLPLLDVSTIQTLIEQRSPNAWATAYRSSSDSLPEPMCAIYEPSAKPIFEAAMKADRRCPRKLLIEGGADVCLIELAEPTALDNANTPEEFTRLQGLAQPTSSAQ
ncbi:molybdenum cofactor guanylyltransferase [Cerasicoccus maritimus]|uniref:molybdenum cofactor guanylyltransferase n=1 Tax=Cerasicoccus maritimus TaxID=490089 RepID=UPI0028528938|nr:molybdenum cofactor guanylyltransferase [Cerasicoccus maritimus]